jgi:hypothetical protein
MVDYAAIATKVTAALTKVGQNAVLKNGTTVIGTVKAVQTESKADDIKSSSLPDLAYAASAMRTFTLAPTKTPAVGYTLTVGGVVLTISEVEEINPAGITLAWKVVAS